MAKGTSSESYAGRVGIGLAVVTVVLTAINGIPPFLALRGKEPYVAYEIGRSQMLYPEDADRVKIRNLLHEQAIPDAFETLSLSNRGDIAAKDVIVSLSLPGRIIAEQTEPRFEIKSARVAVSKEFEPAKDPSQIRYILTNLGLSRTYSIKVSYISEPLGEARWEVFYDGKPGVLVQTLALVPENARAISFYPTIEILGIGLLLSASAYLAIRYREVIRQFPFISSIRAASPKWIIYKNKVVFELAKSEVVTLRYTTNGNMASAEPKNFWDGILEINGNHVALIVHTSDQNWPGIVNNPSYQQAYCLRVYSMAQATEPKPLYIVVANDEEVWSEEPGTNLAAMLTELSGDVRFVCASGSPEEVAKRVIEAASASTLTRS